MTTSAIEMHAALVDAGWRCDRYGRWLSPNPHDARFSFSFDAAWRAFETQCLVPLPLDLDDQQPPPSA